MKRIEVRQLLDLLQVLADDEENETERSQMLMDFGYYTCMIEHSIKLDMWDKRRLNQLKEKFNGRTT